MHGVVEVRCGCWSCWTCRDRRRHDEKAENVPLAARHGTHCWTGPDEAWAAFRKRLQRAGVRFRYFAARADLHTRFVVLVVTAGEESLPVDTDRLETVRGLPLATRLAEVIDGIPAYLPDGTRKFAKSRDWGEWMPGDPVAIERDASPARLPEKQFEVSPRRPFPIDLDELQERLARIEGEFGVDLVIRRGSLNDSPVGGGLEDSILWQEPCDPAVQTAIDVAVFGPEPDATDRPEPTASRASTGGREVAPC